MKLLRKIVLSIFLVQASIASSFSFESGVGFEPPLKAAIAHTNSYSLGDPSVSNPLIFRAAKQSPMEGTVSVTPTYPETGVAYVDPSDTFTNNVFCPTPVIKAHTIYVCSGSAFQYKVPAGGVNNDIVPSTTEYIWSVVFPDGFNDNVTNENLQNNYQQYFAGTTSSSGLVNTSSVQQSVIYSVTPRSGTCTGTPFILTVIVEPPVTVVIGDKTPTAICSGDTFTVTPTTGGGDIVPAGIKYTWTVANNTSVTGESAVTTPQTSISQTLTNTTSQSSTVIYTVTPRFGTDGSCSGPTFKVSVPVNANATITTQPKDNSACLNGTTPDLSVVFANGSGTPTYQWFANTTTSTTTGTQVSTSATYSPPTTTIGTTYYYVKLTFGTGPCSTATSTPAKIEVVGTSSITTQPEALKTICVGGTATPHTVAFAGGTGTAAYQWYSTPTNSNSGGTAITGATGASFTPPSFTTAGDYYYYVVITLTGSTCGSTLTSTVAQVKVIADPVIASQPVASQILCQNATPTNLTASITGGTGTPTYQWFSNTTNANTGGTQLTTNATSATYTPPTTTVGTTYYYVEVSQSASGCKVVSATATVQVVAPPTISTQPLNGVACLGGSTPDLSVAVTGASGTLSYQWFSKTTNSNTGGTAIAGKTAPTFTPPTTTIGTLYYYVEVTQSPSGCKVVSDTATIQIVAQPTVTTQPANAAVCQNETTADLTVAYSGGTGVPTYQWFSNATNLNTGGTAIAGKTAATFTPPTTAVGTLYYYVQLSFATGGCTTVTSSPAKIEVIAVTLTEVADSRKNILCYGDATGNITVRGSGGIKKYTYTITGKDYTGTTISLSSGPIDLDVFSFATLKAGDYVLTITDQTGCKKSTSSITLTQPLAPLQITNDTSKSITCFGKKDGSITFSILGGTAPFKIQWAHGPQGATLNNLEKGVYSVVITDAGGCKVEKQFVINEPQALDLSTTVTDALDCVEQKSGAISINPFGGTPPYTYNWSNGSKTQNLSAIGPGSYSLELVDANGCRVLRQFTIIRPAALEASVVQTTVRVCEPRALKSNFKVNVKGGIPPYTVTWNRGTATNAGLIMDTQELGEFIVTVIDARGCIVTKRMEVIEVDPPVPGFEYKSESFDLTNENLVNFEVKFKNLSTGKYKDISWDFGDTGTSTDPNPTHKYVKEGNYSVVLKLKDLDGCIVSISKNIVITDYYLKFPNVFTPNKDGINDYYYPKMLYISEIEVFILNKFGEILYESKDLEAKGWDGLYKGEQAPIGNYVCKVKHTTLDGRVIDQSSVFYLGR
jgi:gliding motility-associated-like protein